MTKIDALQKGLYVGDFYEDEFPLPAEDWKKVHGEAKGPLHYLKHSADKDEDKSGEARRGAGSESDEV